MSKFQPHFDSATGIVPTRPTWLLVATARPGALPVFNHADDFRAVDEPKAARRAQEPYKWMNLIKPT